MLTPCSCRPEVVLLSSQVCHLTSDLSGFLRTVVGFSSEGEWAPLSALKEHTRNQAPGPHPPTGSEFPPDGTCPCWSPAHRCVRHIPSSASPWSSMESREPYGRAPEPGSWAVPAGGRRGRPVPGNPKPEGKVVTLRGRPTGGGGSVASSQKGSPRGIPAFWEVDTPEETLLEVTHPSRSCQLEVKILTGKCREPWWWQWWLQRHRHHCW